MFKKIVLFGLILFSRSLVRAAAGDAVSVVVSSGTYYSIETSSGTGVNLRQVVAIGSPSTGSKAPVDAVTGIVVQLSSSSATGIGSISAGTAEIGNVKNSGTFATQSAQSGTWTDTVTQSSPGNLLASVSISGSSNTIQGTVTANAGSNLNTSALAVESGGNLATLSGGISASKYMVSIASVSNTPIDTNSGNKSAGTIRTVIATDQPNLTTPLNIAGVVSPPSVAFNVVSTNTILGTGANTIGAISNSGFNVNNTPAVSQSGTWTVQPGNTQNTTAWSVQVGTVGVNASTVAVTNVSGQNLNVSVANSPSVSQSGTWTVQPGNTPNTSAWVVQTTTVGVNASTMAVTNVSGQNLNVSVANSPTVVLAANQSVNVAQINGITPLMGNGVTGTGSQRVTVASDNTPYGVNVTTTVANYTGGAIVFVSTFANVAASQTDQILVQGVSSTRLCVHQLAAVNGGGGAVTLTFNSKAAGAGTAIGPLFANAANGGEVLPFSPVAWFCTNSAEALTATTGANATTGILIIYGKE